MVWNTGSDTDEPFAAAKNLANATMFTEAIGWKVSGIQSLPEPLRSLVAGSGDESGVLSLYAHAPETKEGRSVSSLSFFARPDVREQWRAGTRFPIPE